MRPCLPTKCRVWLGTLLLVGLSACSGTDAHTGGGECVNGTCNAGYVCEDGTCLEENIVDDTSLRSVCLEDKVVGSYPDGCLDLRCVGFPKLLIVEATDSEMLACSGPGGSSDCAATGGSPQQFTYKGELADVHLRFSNDIVGNYSTEAFRASYDSAVISSGLTVEQDTLPTMIEVGSGYQPEDLLYEDGRLLFHGEGDKIVISYTIASSDPNCISGDIVGLCGCWHWALFPHTATFSLPIEE